MYPRPHLGISVLGLLEASVVRVHQAAVESGLDCLISLGTKSIVFGFILIVRQTCKVHISYIGSIASKFPLLVCIVIFFVAHFLLDYLRNAKYMYCTLGLGEGAYKNTTVESIPV